MHFILSILFNGLVILGVAYLLPQIKVRNYRTALWVAFITAILNATVGFLLRLPLNIITLGLLSFFIRILVTGIVIKMVDYLMKGFEVMGFKYSLLLAVALAAGGTLFDFLIY